MHVAIRPLIGALALAGLVCPASVLRAETATWDAPDIDTWLYVNGLGGGSYSNTPTFANLSINDSNDAFKRNGGSDPARLATALIAFETSGTIEPLLDPQRYEINSVTFTITVESGTNGSLLYRDSAITPGELLDAALGSGLTPELPMELFGVGFDDRYDGLALGADQSGTRFNEFSGAYNTGVEGAALYPVVGDGSGGFTDVSNNFTGGFSATNPSGETDPFTATPWAIGAVEGLQPGDAISDDTTFEFSVDLDQPGVRAYVQESLSQGALGFFVSSIHPAAQPGPGSTAFVYPQWFAKEAVGVADNAQPATLAIDFTLLPLVGDYDANGLVETADYDAWSEAYGSTAAPAGSGADGNGDGVVDAADYTVWRDAYDSAAPATATIPEPSAGLIAAAVVACGITHRLRHESLRGPLE